MLIISSLGTLGFVVCFCLTLGLRSWSKRLGLIDVPNSRSGHSIPTPKGGGLAFCLSFFLVTGSMILLGVLPKDIAFPLFFGGPVVAILGWVDDRFTISAWIRLIVHFMVAIFICYLVTGWGQVPIEISFLPKVPWLNFIFCIFFITWCINLFNFMDGADGLVTSVSIVASLLLAVVAYSHGAENLVSIYVVFAYCLFGFLLHNWPPAKIFMGDSGSYFIGFFFSVMALISKLYSNISFYAHIVLFAPFICDTTYTLVMRFLRGERVYNAHRQQAFHKAIDSGWTPQKLSFMYITITILWLFPLANLAVLYNLFGIVFVIIAYLPMILFQVYFKAGLPEKRDVLK